MKFIKYSKYTGEDFGIDAQDLMKALSDFLLQSGFQAQFSEWNSNDLEDLKPVSYTHLTLPTNREV